jgi:hypothetical protein
VRGPTGTRVIGLPSTGMRVASLVDSRMFGGSCKLLYVRWFLPTDTAVSIHLPAGIRTLVSVIDTGVSLPGSMANYFSEYAQGIMLL